MQLGAMNISTGAVVSLAAPISQATRTLLDVQHLNLAGSMGHWTSKLDLNANDLEVTSGTIATMNDQVRQGDTGANGIISSAALTSANHLTTLGAILNSVDGTSTGAALFNAGNLFDTTNPPAGAVLVKYTYYGDTNLDGKVDGGDYTRIDSNHLSQLTGWYNGDLNGDGAVNGSDYTLMDNTFNMQGAALTAMPLAMVQENTHASRLTYAPNTFSSEPVMLIGQDQRPKH